MFYAVFVDAGDDLVDTKMSGKIYPTRREAEDAAKRSAEKWPYYKFFVMKSITRFACKQPDIIRTEIEAD